MLTVWVAMSGVITIRVSASSTAGTDGRPWCWGSSRGLTVIADVNQTIHHLVFFNAVRQLGLQQVGYVDALCQLNVIRSSQ